MVFIFEHYSEAKRFYEVLPKRLKKYGLNIKAEKTQLVRSGQNVAKQAYRLGQRIPTYQFLGFTVYWGKARNGRWWRMKFKSRRDRFTAKLNGLKEFLRKQLTTSDTIGTLKLVSKVVTGWINYHAISDNEPRVKQFSDISRRIIRKWLNRRGRKRPMSWKYFNTHILGKINFPIKWKTKSMFGTKLAECVEARDLSGAGCGSSARPVVRPAKAGVFSER